MEILHKTQSDFSNSLNSREDPDPDMNDAMFFHLVKLYNLSKCQHY